MNIECAWCGKPLGIKDGKGVEGTSHSICPKCAVEFGLDAKQKRMYNAATELASSSWKVKEIVRKYKIPKDDWGMLAYNAELVAQGDWEQLKKELKKI